MPALSFVRQLAADINTVDDVIVFCVAVKYVVAPINRALALVPSDDKKFCEEAAKNILDTFGEEKIALLIETWDNLGMTACLDAERALVVETFTRLLENLSKLNIPHSQLDDAIMMTAFVQEFERRLGQKRKARGGWVIGISCKRTLRERWKQLSQADRGTLSHFKIRELWHLITFDRDLSGLKNYVRPLSNFVGDIRNLI